MVVYNNFRIEDEKEAAKFYKKIVEAYSSDERAEERKKGEVVMIEATINGNIENLFYHILGASVSMKNYHKEENFPRLELIIIDIVRGTESANNAKLRLEEITGVELKENIPIKV